MSTPIRSADLDGCAMVIARNPDDTVDTITVTKPDQVGAGSKQYVCTMGYSGGLLATVSEYVPQ